ncbi:hypothetical protein FPV67DRAFT_1664236 [Lyophyllum atratum]|nr:hypothetical protein FPV67DRAFT_1664236 [Lyophyllum atratum]
METNCIGWAAALMDSVYALVAIEDARYEERMAYLIEELIEKENQGWFIKYLNNDSPKPRVFKDKEKNIRARFLAFAQHVEFEKTQGTVFVSDF